ncbi:hypothetical protein ABEX25_09965, partial [Paenibacillus thiaminolyticus]|uniref:hypothetical protein n=1 Tax=Paenibacillus thiaminolyticus TaxID=49283 RepID=UPI003D2762F3
NCCICAGFGLPNRRVWRSHAVLRIGSVTQQFTLVEALFDQVPAKLHYFRRFSPFFDWIA